MQPNELTRVGAMQQFLLIILAVLTVGFVIWLVWAIQQRKALNRTYEQMAEVQRVALELQRQEFQQTIELLTEIRDLLRSHQP